MAQDKVRVVDKSAWIHEQMLPNGALFIAEDGHEYKKITDDLGVRIQYMMQFCTTIAPNQYLKVSVL